MKGEVMDLEKQLEILENNLKVLTQRRNKIQEALWNHGKVMSINNGKIPELLERIYLKDDAGAREELNKHNAYIQEIKQFKTFGDELLRRANGKISEVEGQIQKLKPQLTHVNNQKAHWNKEYNNALTRLNKATFANFSTIKKRLLDCAAHKYVQKEDEAKELIDAKEKEINRKNTTSKKDSKSDK